jgi:probable glucitol transport protein GutA
LYIFWGMAYTVCDVPANSLAAAMTSGLSERASLVARGRLHSVLEIMAAMVLTMPLVSAFARLWGSPSLAWLSVSAVVATGGYLLMRWLGEVAVERFVDQESKPPKLLDIFSSIKGNGQLLAFFGSLVLVGATNTTTVLPLYFANVNLGDSGKYTLLIMSTMAEAPLVSIFAPRIIKTFDKLGVFLFGLALVAATSVVIRFAGYEGAKFGPFLALSAVRGIGASCSTVMSYMFAADCVEYGAYTNGKRTEGVVFSIQTFTTKLSGTMSGFIAMGLLGWKYGYRSAYYVNGALVNPEQPAETARGIWLLMSIFPAVGAASAILALLRFYKLRDCDVQVMADVNSGTLSREEGEERLAENRQKRRLRLWKS